MWSRNAISIENELENSVRDVLDVNTDRIAPFRIRDGQNGPQKMS